MAVSCHQNGTLCKGFFVENTRAANHTIGFILGAVALLVFIVLIVLLMYMVCCKGYFRKAFSDRLHSSPKPSMNTDVNQQPPQFHSPTSLHEQPPSYQEMNTV